MEALKLHVQHVAWLHAKPEKQKVTHIERLSNNGAAIEYPPLESCGYLLEWLFEVGPINFGGMGPSPLSITEIYRWGEHMNITAFEVGVIRELSKQYVFWNTRGDSPPPYTTEMTEARRDQVSRKLKTMLRMFKGRTNGAGSTRNKG